MWKVEKIVRKGEYNYAIVRNHPHRTDKNYVLYHRIVMENHLGRLLSPSEVVHHKNGNKLDNRIENLEAMDASTHARHHALEHGRLWCELKCPLCKSIFHKEYNQTFLQKGSSYTACSRSCSGKFSRMLQLHGVTHKVESAISENLVRIYRKYIHDNPEETLDKRVP